MVEDRQRDFRVFAERRRNTFLANLQSTRQAIAHHRCCMSSRAGRGNIWFGVKHEYLSAKQTHLSLRSGTPPPTHQSTTQRRAFKLSSRPPLPLPLSAKLFKASRAFVLCRGLLWTSSVSALSRSDSVPDCRIFWRNANSDLVDVAVDEDWNESTACACRADARSKRPATSLEGGLVMSVIV